MDENPFSPPRPESDLPTDRHFEGERVPVERDDFPDKPTLVLRKLLERGSAIRTGLWGSMLLTWVGLLLITELVLNAPGRPLPLQWGTAFLVATISLLTLAAPAILHWRIGWICGMLLAVFLTIVSTAVTGLFALAATVTVDDGSVDWRGRAFLFLLTGMAASVVLFGLWTFLSVSRGRRFFGRDRLSLGRLRDEVDYRDRYDID